jgi:Hemingway/CFA97
MINKMDTNRRPERIGFEKILYNDHLKRLNGVESLVDTQTPRPPPLSNKWKIDNLRNKRRIEKENSIILTRLIKIIESGKSIDNSLHKSVEEQLLFKDKIRKCRKRLELERIMEENKNLHNRLIHVEPAYNHIKWELDAKRNDIIKKNMALYPEYYLSTSTTGTSK